MTGKRMIALLTLALLGLAFSTFPAHAQDDYEATLARAHKLMKGYRDHEAALEAYQAAEALTDSPTFELLSGASGAAVGVQDYKLAAEYCRRAIPVAQNDEERGMAYTQLAMAMIGKGNLSKRKTKAVLEPLRSAIENLGKEGRLARFLLGKYLLKLEQDEEGSQILRDLVGDYPEHQLAPAATALLDDPRRTRMSILPAFEAQTLEGQTISDLSLRGQVVLIDVWATWCAPCRASVPHLKKLHKRMEGEAFTLLGISVDKNEEKLRNYVTNYGMAWPQFWDGERSLSVTRLLATGYPTYIVVDHEGVIRYTTSGWSDQIGSTLDLKIRTALRAARKAAKKL